MTETARRYRGPETWARIRDRYLAGEPAPLLALEYGVGLDKLRRRASGEGWTRKHQARMKGEPNVRWMPSFGEPSLTRRERALHDFQTAWPDIWDELIELAAECAMTALQDRPEDCGPLSAWAYRWRAETFGPECAAEDRQRAQRLAAAGEVVASPPNVR